MREQLQVSIVFLLILCSIVYGYQKNINCGGSEQVLSGITWEADREYSIGDAGYIDGYETVGMWQLGGSCLNSIYSTHRDNVSSYNFDLPNGQYIVKLYFIEQDNHGDNQRVMNVFIEDSLAQFYFDIHSLVEKDYAIMKVYRINVFDEVLNIDFDALIGETTIAGISVVSFEPDTIAPSTPSWQNAFSSYGKIIVDWRENTSDLDFKGYKIYRSEDDDDEWECITSEPVMLTRYFDYDTELGEEYKYKVSSVDVYGNESSLSAHTRAVSFIERGDSDVPIIDIYLNDANLAFLNSDPFADDYVRGDIKCGERLWEDVRIRYRGGVSRNYSKKNFKINFDSDDRFFGIDKLNLNSEAFDVSILRNLFGITLFDIVSIDAPEAYYVSIWLNDIYYGIAVSFEQIDEVYLRNRDYDEDDYIYKCNGSIFHSTEDCSEVWDIECGDGLSDDYQYIRDLYQIMNCTPDSRIEETLDSVFDVENFLRYYATITLVDDFDFTVHNYFLHRRTEDGKWSIIPWDLNLGFQNSEKGLGLGSFYNPQGIIVAPSLLHTRFMGVQSYRERYCDLLDSLSITTFSSEFVSNFVDSIQDFIMLDAQADYRKASYEDGRVWYYSLEDFDEIVRNRVEFVREEIEEFCEFNNPVGICINELCVNNHFLIADDYGEYEPFIELYNLGEEPINLADLSLTDDPFYQDKWRFPPTILNPGEYQIIWLDNEISEGVYHSTLSCSDSGGFLGLFNLNCANESGRYFQAVDLLFYGEFYGSDSWQRFPDGGNIWSFSIPTPNGDNSFGVKEVAHKIKNSNFSVYPNPFNGYCTIEREDSEIVEIFDIYGNRVDLLNSEETEFIPPETLPSGIYLARICSDNKIKIHKINYIK